MAISAACAPPRSVVDPRARYELFGANVQAFAAMRPLDFAEAVHGGIAKNALAYADYLEGLIERHGGQPAAWAADVRELLENVYEFIREPTLLFGPDGCGLNVSEARAYADRYGRLIEMWPELWGYARDARHEGSGLTRKW